LLVYSIRVCKDARKSLLKEYGLDAPRMSAWRLFQILGPAIFMKCLCGQSIL